MSQPLPSSEPPPLVRPRGQVPVLVPHLVWEAVLLVLLVGFVVGAAVRTPLFQSDGFWWLGAVVGLLATGLALSLRTGTPNLAIPGVAAGAGALYAVLVVDVGTPLVLAAGLVLVGSVLLGLGLGLVVGLTSAPAWAVSLAGLAMAQGLLLTLSQSTVLAPGQAPVRSAVFWFGLFLLVSLTGGAVGAVPAVRRLLRPGRSAADPVRFQATGLVRALVGLGGSSGLAGLSGLASVAWLGGVNVVGVSLNEFLLALGAVLVGGVSVYGGRGGIAGTVLALSLLTVTVQWLDVEWRELVDASSGVGQSVRWLLIGLAILAGVGVSRALAAIAPEPPPQL